MTKIDFKLIADNLEFLDDIWAAKSTTKISYPDEANENCFQIEDNSFWFRHRNNCIIEVVKLFPPKGIFYDVGGGNGFVAKELEENGIETVLVEPGEIGVANARKRGIRHIIRATLEDAGFKSHTLSTVGLFDVVEHIEEDKAFLKLVFELLEPGGRLYITVPAFNCLWSGEDDYAGHFRRYTIKNLRKILNEIGFHVEYATYIFSVLLFPIFLFRSLPNRLRLIKKGVGNPNLFTVSLMPFFRGFISKVCRKNKVSEGISKKGVAPPTYYCFCQNNKVPEGINKKGSSKETHKREHSQPGGIMGKLLENTLKMERKRIRHKKMVPFGSSCLIAAKKGPAIEEVL